MNGIAEALEAVKGYTQVLGERRGFEEHARFWDKHGSNREFHRLASRVFIAMEDLRDYRRNTQRPFFIGTGKVNIAEIG